MAKNAHKSKENNSAKYEKRVNPNTMNEALRNLKSRFTTGDVRSMKEVSSTYSTGMPFALGISYETMVDRYNDPRKLTLENILNTADITGTDYEIVLKVAMREALRNHTKRDISKLLPTERETTD
ncbi:MAG: hypothetical protein CMP12_21185 [Zunongwangia sp.]|uniref:Uncharacterized protein n=1 Tax=Zunongwangia profunda (strain DSM 18752 / CCTCC AB 206139 / SM-A87) TaxID=655815 RepID=D5BF04_ZUNPS|nr:hypothetical protein [Zunongwangia profunda]ADF50883.1 hypothetical protein ZPR_0526 [Zunongwangia profunda SM-A87]MAO38374.1 hypothetical protein [Zunongwangia sp.]MAS72448.1 hypothetical protein [Zunongwangia sp.]|tara:strand:- start:11079 stop:11453 length:375 start_codon:yes stop_codon:yes gene_type:complete